MRLALLGNHPDGLELAFALVESGRHRVLSHTAPLTDDARARLGSPQRVADAEEVLADPEVEAIIVAGVPEYRPEQLRRALQSERHVLCVHPADQTPEITYEAAMIQKDTGAVLLPILPKSIHPAVRRLRSLLEGETGKSLLGDVRLVDIEWTSRSDVLENTQFGGTKPSFPGWDVLRALCGEVAEVSGFAPGEELLPGDPVLLAGRFERGGLFQTSLLPLQSEAKVCFTVHADRGMAELLLPLGWDGPAFLKIARDGEEGREESWQRWDPWPVVVEQFEAACAGKQLPRTPSAPTPATAASASSGIQTEAPARRSQAVTVEGPAPAVGEARVDPAMPTWNDEIRCLELDDAARRAVKHRRAQTLEYPEASEEVGFKGTMTLVGCGLLWVTLFLLVLSRWLPALGIVIIPLFLVYMTLQLLRYAIPAKPER
jgi:predicted dehydrogenase